MDIFDKNKRSEVMSRVKGKNTKPEIRVRKILHGLGYRFRLESKILPGKPDIILPKYKKVIFVHGCFWHGHENCKRSKLPSTNTAFWSEKIGRNILRDQKVILTLKELGWDALVIWQCEIRDTDSLKNSINSFLKG